MSKKVYKDHTFKCPECKTKQKHKAWSDDPKAICGADGCDTILYPENVVKEKKAKAPGIRTPTKNRV